MDRCNWISFTGNAFISGVGGSRFESRAGQIAATFLRRKLCCPAEVESRTQGSRPRPRTQKKSEAKVKDSLSEDRHSRGQGQECSWPRPKTKDTSTSALQKKKKVFTKIFQAISKKKTKTKKWSSQKFFRRSTQKNVFRKIFQALHKILTIQKIVLSSSRGRASFRGLEASRPRPRTWPSRPRPRTSKCVLEDSTSVVQAQWREDGPRQLVTRFGVIQRV